MHPTGGIIGLVDDLLAVCREHALELDWQTRRCRVRSSGGNWEELLDLPLRKSVFRAILARMAALCNERRPDSISPYGGHGELRVGPDPATAFRIAIINTSGEQRLELAPMQPKAADGVDTAVSTAAAPAEGAFKLK